MLKLSTVDAKSKLLLSNAGAVVAKKASFWVKSRGGGGEEDQFWLLGLHRRKWPAAKNCHNHKYSKLYSLFCDTIFSGFYGIFWLHYEPNWYLENEETD